MTTATRHTSESEVTILARILCSEDGQLPLEIARYILDRKISERDQARMHDLIVRNQNDERTPAEKEEMFAFGKATTMFSVLKSGIVPNLARCGLTLSVMIISILYRCKPIIE
jgi:hypothetical protein